MTRAAHSYRIEVQYHALNKYGTQTVTHLHVCASTADLAVLLQVLDQSESVARMTVFTTLTFPALHTFGRLTAQDLALTDLKKLS